MTPRKVNVFIEKNRDGHITPVTDVDVREIACGLNHTVSRFTFTTVNAFIKVIYICVYIYSLP